MTDSEHEAAIDVWISLARTIERERQALEAELTIAWAEIARLEQILDEERLQVRSDQARYDA